MSNFQQFSLVGVDVDLYGLITDNGDIRGYTDTYRQVAVESESARNGEHMTKGVFT